MWGGYLLDKRVFSLASSHIVMILITGAAEATATGDYWAERKAAPAPILLSGSAVVDGSVYITGGMASLDYLITGLGQIFPRILHTILRVILGGHLHRCLRCDSLLGLSRLAEKSML